MSGWNYRLLAHEYGDSVSLAIHEVYYDSDGNPNGCTASECTNLGETFKEVRWTLNKMKEALKKPILYYGDRFPEVYEPNL